ncbi:hypothetical protein SDC9_184558 [bioreactor metagenome]|uniref:Uncharacterized protein n=1 Tax=bioreactor metagenome TaxID=1076179 RepID=A0A645HF85_9ZZZZ
MDFVHADKRAARRFTHRAAFPFLIKGKILDKRKGIGNYAGGKEVFEEMLRGFGLDIKRHAYILKLSIFCKYYTA